MALPSGSPLARGVLPGRCDARQFHSPQMSKPPITVSLVLGSGGARGLAHIGVIQWLTENGYVIRSIAGTSMGALVGGIYAADKLPVYTHWVLGLERSHVLRLLDPAIGHSGIFKGERIIAVLRELIGDCDIEKLPISFTAVATDLDAGREVWLRSGPLFDAIRASIATPMVFASVEQGQRTLIDGAVVNPVPVAPTLEDDTDLTIAVDLSGPAEHRPPAPPAPPLADNPYSRRILKFVDSVRPARTRGKPARGPLDVAFLAMQTMHDTIADLEARDRFSQSNHFATGVGKGNKRVSDIFLVNALEDN